MLVADVIHASEGQQEGRKHVVGMFQRNSNKKQTSDWKAQPYTLYSLCDFLLE